MKDYYTAEKKTGTFIDRFSTMTEALAAIEGYKEEDKRNKDEDGSKEIEYEVENENHMTFDSSLGNHIKECREKAGITPEKLLDAIGDIKGNISQYEETEENPAPDLSQLKLWKVKKIADICGVTVDDLIK